MVIKDQSREDGKRVRWVVVGEGWGDGKWGGWVGGWVRMKNKVKIHQSFSSAAKTHKINS